MAVPAGIRTPGVYLDVNLDTQRMLLSAAIQKILFVTTDTFVNAGVTMPQPLYDNNAAVALFGQNSNAGVMINAALAVNQMVVVQALGK